MKKFIIIYNSISNSYIFVIFTSIFIAYPPLIQADVQQDYDNQTIESHSYNSTESITQLSYGKKIGLYVIHSG